MKNDILFSTQSHTYLYSCRHLECIPVHPIFQRIWNLLASGESVEIYKDVELSKYHKKQVDYYLRKYHYLKDNLFISQKEEPEFALLSEDTIRKELENLTVLTFEVTDRCNLRCRYCAYGELYSGYDERKEQNMNFETAKAMLDYLFSIWEQTIFLSSTHTVGIGFYGGEPLMNFELIKQVIDYISEHAPLNMNFVYNMTTNAMLLSRYQDYLCAHQFTLLISLDGTETDDCHRLTINGKSSFDTVFEQVKGLQLAYPEYFKNKVFFNSVVHSESDIERILDFFEREFDKKTTLNGLSNKEIANQEKYKSMYKSVVESIIASKRRKEIDEKLMYNSPEISSLTYYLHHMSNEVFKNYRVMFYGTKKLSLLPTGSCIPFNRKLFVTVNGKILVCERIAHEFAVGQVSASGVDLNLKQIASTYNDKYYGRIIPKCKKCYMQSFCSQCLFYTGIREEPVFCKGFRNYKGFANYLAINMDYLEKHPWAYEKVMKEISLF